MQIKAPWDSISHRLGCLQSETDNEKCWWDCGETESLINCCEDQAERWRCRRTWAHLLHELQNCNPLLNSHRQENVGSHEKKIPHTRGQSRSPNKMVRGAKSHLESNPRPTRGSQKAQTKPFAHQDPETRQRLSQNCIWVSPVEVWVSSGLPQGRGAGDLITQLVA